MQFRCQNPMQFLLFIYLFIYLLIYIYDLVELGCFIHNLTVV